MAEENDTQAPQQESTDFSSIPMEDLQSAKSGMQDMEQPQPEAQLDQNSVTGKDAEPSTATPAQQQSQEEGIGGPGGN